MRPPEVPPGVVTVTEGAPLPVLFTVKLPVTAAAPAPPESLGVIRIRTVEFKVAPTSAREFQENVCAVPAPVDDTSPPVPSPPGPGVAGENVRPPFFETATEIEHVS